MSQSLIKSARRVFDILELFRERQKPLRLKDIVEALELPTSSAAALLKTMTEMSYLSFDSKTHCYLPTLRFSQLGDWITSASYERGPILEAVHNIGRKIGETVLVGTPVDIYVEIVEVCRASEPIQYYTTVGARVLLVHSGIGWPLLSHARDDEIAAIHRRTLKRGKNERAITSVDRLKIALAAVRAEGYCLSRGMVDKSVGVIGMMLPTPAQHRPLAVGVAGPLSRIEKNKAKILSVMLIEVAKLTRFIKMVN